jgi:hypothetical protein
VFHATQVITAYRDPFEVLVSEYNDFRFIRKDVKFCSRDAEPDDILAFGIYLERQAPVIRDILIEMGRYLDCFSEALYAPKYKHFLPLVINFNRLNDADYLLWLDQLFSSFLPNSETTFVYALRKTFGKQTKTKSTGYCFDTASLWNSSNQALVKPLRLKRLHRNLLDQEQVIQASMR